MRSLHGGPHLCVHPSGARQHGTKKTVTAAARALPTPTIAVVRPHFTVTDHNDYTTDTSGLHDPENRGALPLWSNFRSGSLIIFDARQTAQCIISENPKRLLEKGKRERQNLHASTISSRLVSVSRNLPDRPLRSVFLLRNSISARRLIYPGPLERAAGHGWAHKHD